MALLLSGLGTVLPLSEGEPFVIERNTIITAARGRGMELSELSISRLHLRVTVVHAAHPPDPMEVLLEQLGRHPTRVYRNADLAAIGWLSPEKASAASAAGVTLRATTPEQVAARSERGRLLQKGESMTVTAGDAFGIQGDRDLWPFWIAPLRPGGDNDTMADDDPHDEHPPPQPVSSHQSHVPAAALTPPSLSRSDSVQGPVSAFYGNFRTDSLTKALEKAQQLDGGKMVDTYPVQALREREAMAAIEEERQRIAREEALWSLDDYLPDKKLTIRPYVGPKGSSNSSNSNINQRAAALPPNPATLGAMTVPPPRMRISSPAPASSSGAAAAAAASAVSVSAGVSASSAVAAIPAAAAAASSAISPPPPASALTPTLAVPSLSTADFQFDPEKALPILERTLTFFLAMHSDPAIRVWLVLPMDAAGALTPSSTKVAAYFERHEIDARFSVRGGDLCALGDVGISASFLVHPTTYRYSGGEGGVLNRYLSPDFASRMHNAYGAAGSGRVYVSRIDPSGELVKRCPGLQVLLTVRPPNQNDARPDSLRGDYNKGCRELRETYDAIFKKFEELSGIKRNGGGNAEQQAAPIVTAAATAAAVMPASMSTAPSQHLFAASMPVGSAHSPAPLLPIGVAASSSPVVAAAAAASSSVPAAAAASSPAAAAASASSFHPPSALPSYSPPAVTPLFSGHFQSFLYNYIRIPRAPAITPCIYFEDAECTIIYDAYPKAKVHLLILPRKQQVKQIADLNSSNIGVVDMMDSRAQWIMKQMTIIDARGMRIPLRVGFHAVPSMHLMHAHVISSDLDSAALKNKKHWNSFASPFFLSPGQLKSLVGQHSGASPADLASALNAYAKYEKGNLICNRVGCGLRVLNMPELKKHLAFCHKPYPQ